MKGITAVSLAHLFLVLCFVRAQVKETAAIKFETEPNPPAPPVSEPVAAATDPEGKSLSDQPSPRFLGLFSGKGGGLFGDLFNPCGQCGHYNLQRSKQCCMKGDRHCCRYVEAGFNVGGGYGFGGHGYGGPGFGKPGYAGPPGFGHGHGHGHVPPVPGSGYKPDHLGGGYHGTGHGHGHGSFHATTKPGFCPKPSIFGHGGLFGGKGLFRDDSGAYPGTRSLDNEEVPPVPVVRSEGSAVPEGPDAVAAAEKPIRFTRQIKVTPKEDHQKDAVAADVPNQRFLFGFKNPLCNDDCFTDYDCPGHLKCCLDYGNCKKCTEYITFY